MISLSQPVRRIAGHTVFQDHAEPSRFYVAPADLQITLREDSQPDIGLVQYAGPASDAGSGDVDWGGLFSLVTETTSLEAALSEIRAAMEADGLIVTQLTPMNFDGGMATIAIPNLETPSADDNGVTDALLHLQSRLPGAGRLTAAFNTALTGQEAALMAATLGRDGTPLLLSYELRFTGIREALEVEVEADWERVLSSMENELGVNVYYVSADVDIAVKKAFQDSNLKITSTSLKADATEDLAAAENMLVDMVKTLMFDSAPPLQPPAPSLGDTISDVVSGVIDSVVPGVRYKLKMLSLEERKALNLNLARSEAETRPFFLHTSLGEALRRTLAEAQDESDDIGAHLDALFDDMMTVIRIPESPRLNLDVMVADRFATDGLHSLIVDIELPDPSDPDTVMDQDTLVFSRSDIEAETPPKTIGFVLSRPEDGLSAPVRYRVTAELDPSSAFGRHGRLTGDWRTTSARTLDIDPRITLPYRVETVHIMPGPGFTFAQYPNIGVELRHVAGAGDVHDTHMATLTADMSQLSWPIFREDDADRVEVRLTFVPPTGQGQTIVQDWRPVTNEIVLLTNPLPASRKLNIFNRLEFEGLQLATLELTYLDEDNGHQIVESLVLDSNVPIVSRQYGIMDPAKTTMSYRLTVFSTETDLVVGDWRVTDDVNLVVSNDLVLTRQIRMQVLGKLEDEALDKVVIELRRKLSNTEADTEHRAEFKVGGPMTSNWTFGQPPNADRTLDVQAKFVAETGQVQTLPWRETSRNLIVVRTAQRELVV